MMMMMIQEVRNGFQIVQKTFISFVRKVNAHFLLFNFFSKIVRFYRFFSSKFWVLEGLKFSFLFV